MRELDLLNGRVGLTRQTVEDMLLCDSTAEVVDDVLRRYGLGFSSRSVENVARGLRIFKETKVGVPCSFLIYGSTARGTAGTCPKVQEFQFWKGNLFCGSTFRSFGVSDLDLRCISPEPQEVLNCLSAYKNLPVFTENAEGVRVDDLSYAKKEIVDMSTTSFYRRTLLLNCPIVLSGRDIITSLIEFGYPCLTPLDFSYEKELHESKAFLELALRNENVIYIYNEELTARFPEYYNPKNLSLANAQRGKSFKVSFGQRESSLVTISVKDGEDIKRFTDCVLQHPDLPFSKLWELLSQEN